MPIKSFEEHYGREELRELNIFYSQQAVKYLLKNYDIDRDRAQKVVELLGANDAMKYTEFFFNTNLERNLYLLGAASIAGKIIDFDELLLSTFSNLELMVKDTQDRLRHKPYRKRT